jgi:hypothetical protein
MALSVKTIKNTPVPNGSKGASVASIEIIMIRNMTTPNNTISLPDVRANMVYGFRIGMPLAGLPE